MEPREPLAPASPSDADAPPAIEVTGGYFAWGEDSETLPLRGAALRVAAGELACVVGPVGCGKTTLLHALLGELRAVRGSEAAVRGDVAYCAQTAFIVSGTVEENITFGRPMDRALYRRVVFAAALEPDLKELVRVAAQAGRVSPAVVSRPRFVAS